MRKYCNLVNQYGKQLEIIYSFSSTSPNIYILIPGFLGSIENPPLPVLFEVIHKHQSIVGFNFKGKENADFPTITECLSDLQCIIEFFHTNHDQRVILIGHSLGALISSIVATNQSLKQYIKTLILLACPSTTQHFDARHAIIPSHDVDFVHVQLKEKCTTIEKKFITEYESIDVLKLMKMITMKTLIIHGEKDSIVPVNESSQIYNALESEKYLYIIPNAGHTFSTSEIQNDIALTILNSTQE